MNNEENIKETIKSYIDGYLNADSEIMRKAFHPEANLFGISNEKIVKTSMSDWLAKIEIRKKQADIKMGQLEILLIDVTDHVAFAKTLLTLETLIFTDYLSLVKVDDRWTIVSKLYSSRSR